MTEIARRTLLAAAAATTAASPYPVGAPEPSEPSELLWPAGAPGGAGVSATERWAMRTVGRGGLDRAVTGVTRPRLFVFRAAKPRGEALLVIPGGGYIRQAYDHEGVQVARLLNGRGIDAYVLVHRLPQDGWAAGPLTPLQDSQRALRLVRRRAGPRARVGVLGFSAGGHVAGRLATSADEASYAPVDEADRLSARPDYAGLIYPVATMIEPLAHPGSRAALLGASPSPAVAARESLERRVNASTPPVFLAHAADDPAVPVANSLNLFAALHAARVRSELHVFERGGHGFGLTLSPDSPGALWPELFLRWAAQKELRP